MYQVVGNMFLFISKQHCRDTRLDKSEKEDSITFHFWLNLKK